MEKHEACHRLHLLLQDQESTLDRLRHEFNSRPIKRGLTKTDEFGESINKKIKDHMDNITALNIAASALTK